MTKEYSKLEALLGKTLRRVERQTLDGDDAIVMEGDTGDRYAICHVQDCCESVTIEDICGDLDDLVGSPILLAEEATQGGGESELAPPGEFTPESSTWTFYKFATAKGFVDVRFFGSSNGYYSESAGFYTLTNEDD